MFLGRPWRVAPELCFRDKRETEMASKKTKRLSMVVAVVASLVIGVVTGLIWQFQTVKRAHRDSWVGTISRNVPAIRLIKEGNVDGAIKVLEGPLESCVLQLGKAFGNGPDYSPRDLRILQLAKAYQQEYPSWNPQQEVVNLLAQVPLNP